MRVLFTATESHARETDRYEQRNKEMKVVFSPNLHLSVYPGTSAFYCDKATCTREKRVHKMKDRLDRSCTLLIARFEYEWRDKEMKVTAVQIFISPYTRVPVLFTATEPHAREQREYTK